METDAKIGRDQSFKSWIRSDSVRSRLLWIGLITCFLILLNDVRYVRSSPVYVIILGCLINAGLIFVFVIELRKIYKRRRNDRTFGSGGTSVS
jgi:hypothetical protein